MKIKRSETLQKIETENLPKISIDIFIEVIDNYGDMGWILECMIMSGLDTHWNIVTNDREKMQIFLERSDYKVDNYFLIPKKEYDPKSASKFLFLPLHTEVDIRSFPEWSIFLRINYLSFDPWYTKIHLEEHISSTEERKIIELSYSPLLENGWVWHYPKTKITRWDWLAYMNLEKNLENKVWIPIFAYERTLENLDFSGDGNTVIFQIGGKKKIPWAIYFDWIPRDDFWDLLDLADMSIIRGEISLVRALSTGKTFLWDMYKELGGWNREESTGFLDFIEQNENYKKIHTSLNSGIPINKNDLFSIRDDWQEKNMSSTPDFTKTLQKTLDSFGFSL